MNFWNEIPGLQVVVRDDPEVWDEWDRVIRYWDKKGDYAKPAPDEERPWPAPQTGQTQADA